MLRSTRLVTIALSIVILSTLAPAAIASPSQDFSFGFDVSSKIEAVFSMLENIFSDWSKSSAEVDADLQADPESFIPGADPNGFTSESEPGDGEPTAEFIPGADPNG